MTLSMHYALPKVTEVVAWQRGVAVSVVHRMKEVTLCWAQLVLGWVTVFGRVYHHDM